MTTDVTTSPAVPFNKTLVLSGAVLVGLGGLLVAAGTGLGTYALVTAGRELMKQMDTPPAVLARQKLDASKLAGRAAADAWRAQSGARPAVRVAP